MIGIDTNVLVRYLVRDDAAQFERARRRLHREADAGDGVLISLLVVLEIEWVLRSRYQLPKSDILGAFSALLDSADVSVDDEPSLEESLYLWKDSTADFADCLITARHRRLGCSATATFDAKALRLTGFVAV
jgi:predicted nucleic-acid-binding protein